jgi:hypothetical protein
MQFEPGGQQCPLVAASFSLFIPGWLQDHVLAVIICIEACKCLGLGVRVKGLGFGLCIISFMNPLARLPPPKPRLIILLNGTCSFETGCAMTWLVVCQSVCGSPAGADAVRHRHAYNITGWPPLAENQYTSSGCIVTFEA